VSSSSRARSTCGVAVAVAAAAAAVVSCSTAEHPGHGHCWLLAADCWAGWAGAGHHWWLVGSGRSQKPLGGTTGHWAHTTHDTWDTGHGDKGQREREREREAALSSELSWGTGLIRFAIATHYRRIATHYPSITTHYHALPRITTHYHPLPTHYPPITTQYPITKKSKHYRIKSDPQSPED
jgi:hypothetical protein